MSWSLRIALLSLTILFAGCANREPYSSPMSPAAVHGYQDSGLASYYAKRHAGRRTASGERYNPSEMTAAHRTLPFGTRVEVTNLSNGKRAVVRINDRGPHVRGRIIDLSRNAASSIGLISDGVAKAQIRALD
ncbi:septal ring lytic transglycosylase RlpA family protein [Pseudomonas luteola]|uniref:septal ring lytic transglycosylase RlpA family protein n=1 Tax=Pseudomonas luteola TaxID=47886 RepID=UPI003A8B07E1